MSVFSLFVQSSQIKSKIHTDKVGSHALCRLTKVIPTAVRSCALAVVLLFSGFGAANAGVVSVSNYPLALLSKAVTQGHNDAEVLLSAGDVGHHGSLSPSKMKLVKDSDYVVWFGENLEQNLVKTLKDAPNSIALLDFNAFVRLPMRDLAGNPKADSQDVHIWLEPKNAKAIVRALAVIHSHASPEYQEIYQKNADAFIAKMNEAVAKVSQAPTQPYWAYHDAYQYIEQAAKLKFAGALTPDHHLSPKISQIHLLNKGRPKAHMCLISQGEVSEGIQSKLGNLSLSVQQEDMSGGEGEFVQAWLAAVQAMQRCAQSTLS